MSHACQLTLIFITTKKSIDDMNYLENSRYCKLTYVTLEDKSTKVLNVEMR